MQYMNRHINSRLLIFASLMILGMMLAVQFRSTLYSNRQKTSVAIRIEELKTQINAELEVKKKLEEQIQQNEKLRDEYLNAFADSSVSDYQKQLGEDLNYARLAAGLTDVKGKGIIINMLDAPADSPLNSGKNPELLVHDSDIKGMVNELKKAGAQAISINGERLTAMSELICAGPTIRINNNRYAVPYEIKAIGDPELLFESIDMSGLVNDMRIDNVRVDIKKSDDIIIPKYRYSKIDDLISMLEVVEE